MTIIPTVDYVLQFKLWSKVKIEDPNRFYDSCWLFQGLKSEFGHGRIAHRGTNYWAHRVSYMLAHGLKELAEDVVIRHKCDVPSCVNPLHLETGSKIDNDLDRHFRGRTPTGITHGNSLFTDTRTIREIRWLYQEAGGVKGTCSAIARRYSTPEIPVSKTVIRYICIRQSWAHVEDDFDTLEPKPVPLTKRELYKQGSDNHGGSNIIPKDVQRIRALRSLGWELKPLAVKFNLSVPGVSVICSRKTWTDVPDAKPGDVLTPEEIAEVTVNLRAKYRAEIADFQEEIRKSSQITAADLSVIVTNVASHS
jgi:hypothetical protein